MNQHTFLHYRVVMTTYFLRSTVQTKNRSELSFVQDLKSRNLPLERIDSSYAYLPNLPLQCGGTSHIFHSSDYDKV